METTVSAPENATKRLAELDAPLVHDGGEWPRMLVGGVAGVTAQIDEMASELDVDEFMLVTVVHGHAARRRSYELLAHAYGLVRAAEAPAKA